MRVQFCTTLVCFSFFLGGCAIHPQTEDFSRSTVPDIVHKIKCECQKAILDTIPDPDDYLRKSGVTLAFFFLMKENNDASIVGSVTVPTHIGSWSIGYEAGGGLQRQSTQKISISYTFEDLLQVNCNGSMPRENFKYPITGEIGLYTTFFNYAKVMDQHIGKSLVTENYDEIEFLTTKAAAIKPSFRLIPKVGRLISADGLIGSARSDTHRLTVTFAPARTKFQEDRAAQNAMKKRKKELERLAEEKNIPNSVWILDADGMVIEQPMVVAKKLPTTRPKSQNFTQQENGDSSKSMDQIIIRERRSRPSVPRATESVQETPEDVRERAARAGERANQQLYQDELRREIDR